MEGTTCSAIPGLGRTLIDLPPDAAATKARLADIKLAVLLMPFLFPVSGPIEGIGLCGRQRRQFNTLGAASRSFSESFRRDDDTPIGTYIFKEALNRFNVLDSDLPCVMATLNSNPDVVTTNSASHPYVYLALDS